MLAPVNPRTRGATPSKVGRLSCTLEAGLGCCATTTQGRRPIRRWSHLTEGTWSSRSKCRVGRGYRPSRARTQTSRSYRCTSLTGDLSTSTGSRRSTTTSPWMARLSTTSSSDASPKDPQTADPTTDASESPFPLHLSPSQIKSLLSCGEQFRLNRQLHVPERPMWASVGGSTVHKVTEILDRELMENR
jgi:hypothetical protein